MYGGNTKFVDDSLVRMFSLLPFIQTLIVLLIIGLASVIVLRFYGINLLSKRKGVTRELDNIKVIRKRDASIIRMNKILVLITKFIERTPLALDKSLRDYWEYNIKRAGLKVPGGFRHMTALEFNAIVKTLELVLLGIDIIILLLFNATFGWVLIVFTIVMSSSVPKMIVRQIVKEKDLEITENFVDLYLMIHYVLLAGASTPLSNVMRSYAKATSSKEMKRFVDVCVNHIDVYGEYEATRYIAKDYRELPEVTKLMRLIRQVNEGGDIKSELIGFRSELINAKQYAITKRVQKLIGRANASFNILMIVLVQAILSAMSIYLPDLSILGNLVK